MATLRRRLVNLVQDSPSTTPSRESTPDAGEEVKLISTKKLEKLTKRKGSKKRSGIYFGLGGILGLVLALLFAQSQDACYQHISPLHNNEYHHSCYGKYQRVAKVWKIRVLEVRAAKIIIRRYWLIRFV